MKTRQFLVLLFASLVALASTALAQNTPTEATVTRLTGNATAKLLDGSTVAVTKDMKLPLGAEITTGDASQVTLQAHEGIVAIANSKTTIAIEELSVSANGTRNATIALKSGNLASSLDPTKKSVNNYSVRTPKGVAAARGTTYSVEFNGTTFSVTVVAGVVQSFSVTGASLGNTSAGNVSTSGDSGMTTQTLAEAIASQGASASEGLAALASAVAQTSGDVSDTIAIVQAIATAAGNSAAATTIVAQVAGSAAEAVTSMAGGNTDNAAQIVSAAVVAAAQAGNSAAAGTIVATATTAIAATQFGVTDTVATALTNAANTAAANAGITGVNVNAAAVATAATNAAGQAGGNVAIVSVNDGTATGVGVIIPPTVVVPIDLTIGSPAQ